jgi:hypothetical protein
VPQVSCRPLRIQFTLKNPFIFATMATWGQAFNRSSRAARALRQRGLPHQWKEEMERRRIFRGQWRRITVRDAAGTATLALAGQSSPRSRRPGARIRPNTILDLALADGSRRYSTFP